MAGTNSILVKICGITSADDARMALDAGADWIGLNFVDGPRKIDLPRARDILSDISQPERIVALVSFDQRGPINVKLDAIKDLGIARLQPYGHVTIERIADLRNGGFEVIYVQHVAGEHAIKACADLLTRCGDLPPDYVLLDASVAGKLGGTGKPANWESLAEARHKGRFDGWPPIILAGGLTPANVTQAIRTVHPAGVDVSSGTESRPGRKDPKSVRAFIQAARSTRLRG